MPKFKQDFLKEATNSAIEPLAETWTKLDDYFLTYARTGWVVKVLYALIGAPIQLVGHVLSQLGSGLTNVPNSDNDTPSEPSERFSNIVAAVFFPITIIGKTLVNKEWQFFKIKGTFGRETILKYIGNFIAGVIAVPFVPLCKLYDAIFRDAAHGEFTIGQVISDAAGLKETAKAILKAFGKSIAGAISLAFIAPYWIGTSVYSGLKIGDADDESTKSSVTKGVFAVALGVGTIVGLAFLAILAPIIGPIIAAVLAIGIMVKGLVGETQEKQDKRDTTKVEKAEKKNVLEGTKNFLAGMKEELGKTSEFNESKKELGSFDKLVELGRAIISGNVSTYRCNNAKRVALAIKKLKSAGKAHIKVKIGAKMSHDSAENLAEQSKHIAAAKAAFTSLNITAGSIVHNDQTFEWDGLDFTRKNADGAPESISEYMVSVDETVVLDAVAAQPAQAARAGPAGAIAMKANAMYAAGPAAQGAQAHAIRGYGSISRQPSRGSSSGSLRTYYGGSFTSGGSSFGSPDGMRDSAIYDGGLRASLGPDSGGCWSDAGRYDDNSFSDFGHNSGVPESMPVDAGISPHFDQSSDVAQDQSSTAQSACAALGQRAGELAGDPSSSDGSYAVLGPRGDDRTADYSEADDSGGLNTAVQTVREAEATQGVGPQAAGGAGGTPAYAGPSPTYEGSSGVGGSGNESPKYDNAPADTTARGASAEADAEPPKNNSLSL